MDSRMAVVIVNTRKVGAIRNDPEFGAKLYNAICMHSDSYDYTAIESGPYTDAAMVVDVHHINYNAVIAVGKDSATILGTTTGWDHSSPEGKFKILACLASDLGYALVPKDQVINDDPFLEFEFPTNR